MEAIGTGLLIAQSESESEGFNAILNQLAAIAACFVTDAFCFCLVLAASSAALAASAAA